MCFVLPIARFSSEVLLVKLTTKASLTLRMHLCRQILSAPMRLLEELGSHRLLATLTDDIPAITNALITLPLLFMHIALVIGSLVYLGWLSTEILVWLIVLMIVGIITYQIPVFRAMKYYKRLREEWDALLKHFRTIVYGTKELKLNQWRREEFFSQFLKPTAESLRRQHFIGSAISSAATSYGQSLIFVFIGLIIFGMPGMTGITTKTLNGYTLALLYMMTPLQVILNMIPNLARATIAIQKVEEVGLSLKARPAEIGVAPERGAILSWDSLELIDVTHSYRREGEENDFILGPVNLTFTPGELVFIGGGNGSGKTTLAKLLTGIYAPVNGHIRLNGRTVNDSNIEYYRHHFSAVFYDFYLFEFLLGLDKTELDDRAFEYLVQLRIDNKVKIKDGKLSTLDLSQGQRKRLALLTAYLEDRPIYVFDEWAADQDPVFKDVFYHQILPELKERGKTVLVITHDDRYYHIADRIIRLDSGSVVYDSQLTIGRKFDNLSSDSNIEALEVSH